MPQSQTQCELQVLTDWDMLIPPISPHLGCFSSFSPVSNHRIFCFNVCLQICKFKVNLHIAVTVASGWGGGGHHSLSRNLTALFVVCSGQQQSSKLLALCGGWPVDSPHKGQVIEKGYPCYKCWHHKYNVFHKIRSNLWQTNHYPYGYLNNDDQVL